LKRCKLFRAGKRQTQREIKDGVEEQGTAKKD